MAEVEVLPHHGAAANCANQADGGVSAGGATLALGDGAAAAPAVHNERSGVRFDTRTRQWRHADDDSLPAGALRHAAAVPTNQGPADCRQELARERAAREALERRVAQLEQIVLRSLSGSGTFGGGAGTFGGGAGTFGGGAAGTFGGDASTGSIF